MQLEIWLPAVLAGSAAVFGVLTLVLLWEVVRDLFRRMRARRQLRDLAGVSVGDGSVAQAASLLRSSGASQVTRTLARALPGTGAAQRLLRQARVDMGPESFVMLCVGAGAGFGLTAYLVSGLVPIAVMVAAVGAFLPYGWISRRRTLRERAFEERFPEAIELLTRAIRAGHPVSSGIRMVGEDASPGVAEEFRTTFEEQRFGLPFEDAMANLVHRNDQVDVRIFATALLVQRDVGGNLAEILDNLAATIRDRFFVRRQLRVYTAQGRMTGWVLGLLPIAVGTFIWLMEPEYMGLLLEGAGGHILLGLAAFLQLVGVLWIRRVMAIEI